MKTVLAPDAVASSTFHFSANPPEKQNKKDTVVGGGSVIPSPLCYCCNLGKYPDGRGQSIPVGGALTGEGSGHQTAERTLIGGRSSGPPPSLIVRVLLGTGRESPPTSCGAVTVSCFHPPVCRRWEAEP